MDAELFKAAMGGVCGPVTVVTTKRTDGEPHGTTVSAMASLSLEPPMVTVSLALTSELLAHAKASGRIGINVLRLGQDDVAMTFARSGAVSFDGVDWDWDDDLPRLDGVGVWIAGEVEHAVPGGDHEILLTRVVDCAVDETAPPLVYARRAFGTHSAFAPGNA